MFQSCIPAVFIVALGFAGIFGQNGSPAPSSGDLLVDGVGRGANEKDAVLAAKRNAVERAIELLLVANIETEKCNQQRSQILSQETDRLSKFEIISKSQDSLAHVVTIRAQFHRNSLRENLARFHILVESMEKPKVMVVMVENYGQAHNETSSVSEKMVCQFLKDPYQFEIVDLARSMAVRESPQKIGQVNQDPVAAAKIGAQYGADVLIAGKVDSREIESVKLSLAGLRGVKATISLGMVDCFNGKVLESLHGDTTGVNPNPDSARTSAIAYTVQKLQKGILDTIFTHWQSHRSGGDTIILTIGGVATFHNKIDALQTLRSIRGVAGVTERGWDGKTKVLLADVSFKGTVGRFCENLEGLKTASGSGSLTISSVKGNAISVGLQVM